MLPERLNALTNGQKARLLNIQFRFLDQTQLKLNGLPINLFSCHAASSNLEKDRISNRQNQDLTFFLHVPFVVCVKLVILHTVEVLQ